MDGAYQLILSSFTKREFSIRESHFFSHRIPKPTPLSLIKFTTQLHFKRRSASTPSSFDTAIHATTTKPNLNKRLNSDKRQNWTHSIYLPTFSLYDTTILPNQTMTKTMYLERQYKLQQTFLNKQSA